jgi:hypothetical protein
VTLTPGRVLAAIPGKNNSRPSPTIRAGTLASLGVRPQPGWRAMPRLYTSYWMNEALALPPHDKALKVGISRGGPRRSVPTSTSC